VSTATRLLETSIGSGPEAPRRARELLRTLSGALPDEVIDDLALLVSELVTNSFRHARIESGAPIGVRVQRTGTGVRVEVSDAGAGDLPEVRKPSGEGGWGLRIVQELSNDWGVARAADGGAVVWFEIELPHPELAWSSDHFTVSTVQDLGKLIVRCGGELDIDTAGPVEDLLRRAIATDKPDQLLLDWSELTFMDSTGIRLLLRIVAMCRRASIDVLWRLSAIAQRALDIVGIHDGLLREFGD
jgi:anti-anti-sigma factor